MSSCLKTCTSCLNTIFASSTQIRLYNINYGKKQENIRDTISVYEPPHHLTGEERPTPHHATLQSHAQQLYALQGQQGHCHQKDRCRRDAFLRSIPEERGESMQQHQLVLSSHTPCHIQQSRGERHHPTATPLQECIHRHRQDQQAGHPNGSHQPDKASDLITRPYHKTRNGKRHIPDVLLSAWHLLHRLGAPPLVRPQRRLPTLHPKQDRTTPHHTLGKGDAGHRR